jgi:hypothetical protein
MARCSLTSPGDLLKRVDFDSKSQSAWEPSSQVRDMERSEQYGISNQETSSNQINQQLAVSIQREQSAHETEVKFSPRES